VNSCLVYSLHFSEYLKNSYVGISSTLVVPRYIPSSLVLKPHLSTRPHRKPSSSQIIANRIVSIHACHHPALFSDVQNLIFIPMATPKKAQFSQQSLSPTSQYAILLIKLLFILLILLLLPKLVESKANNIIETKK
jgi:hypothetical protein